MFLRTLLYIIGGFAAYQALLRLVRRYWNFPAPAIIARFLDSRLRQWMQPADRLVARSGIRPGQRVLEIGCGSGGQSLPVARALGPTGHLDALDIQASMLDVLRARLASPAYADVTNVTLHQASAYALPFPDATFDVVYLVSALQEIPDKARALAEAHRVLKPGAYLAVSEFLPDPDYPWARTTVAQAQAAGFTLEAVEGNLWSYTVRMAK